MWKTPSYDGFRARFADAQSGVMKCRECYCPEASDVAEENGAIDEA